MIRRGAMLAIALTVCAAASAQEYPNRPVRMIMPYPAGGATDIIGRLVAENLSVPLGQQVLVDNRGGASALLGTAAAAKSPPDGYTIVMLTSTNAINQTLQSKLPFDLRNDFAPITLIAKAAQMLVIHPEIPAKSLEEFVAYAKARPGKLNYGSAGVGVSGHLAMEALKSRAGMDLVHIAYKGGAPVMTDLLGGQIAAMFSNAIGVMPYIRNGKMRALGVSSSERSVLTPDVPTIAERGYPGFEVSAWFGIAAPAGTPRPIVSRLNGETTKLLANPQVQEKLLALGAETTRPYSIEQFAQFIKDDIVRWAESLKAANVKPE